jgi:hypothetical protein
MAKLVDPTENVNEVSLKELMESQFESMSTLLNERFQTSVKALDAAFAAAKLAVDTAQLAADKAVDRERSTTNQRLDAIDNRLADLSSAMDKNTGGDNKASSDILAKRFNMVLAISIISVVTALLALILPHLP